VNTVLIVTTVPVIPFLLYLLFLAPLVAFTLSLCILFLQDHRKRSTPEDTKKRFFVASGVKS
jgi:hypothetical protein